MTLEQLDTEHGHIVRLTKAIMFALVTAGVSMCIWHSGAGDDYFKGASTCPSLSAVRQAIARYDANVFYYYKPSLATYCDIEDSFWRLLMDGWMRGVVSGSDSLLLLGAILPKAWMFKTAVCTFAQPIYAGIFALIGLTLTFIGEEAQDGARMLMGRLMGSKRAPAAAPAAAAPAAAPAPSDTAPTAAPPSESGSPSDETPKESMCAKTSKKFRAKAKAVGAFLATSAKAAPAEIMRFPKSAYTRLTTKSTIFATAWQLFVALGCSGLLRVALHYGGYDKLAALGKPEEVNMWQLLFEPVLFFYLARCCTWASTKLDKTLWKKAKPNAAAPLTFRRTKPYKDITEMFTYNRSRFTRMFNSYQVQGNGLLSLFLDDVFNTVIVLRALGIFLHAAPVVRQALRVCGLGSMLDRHRAWFMGGTGYVDTDLDTKYVSDRLFSFGLRELFVGLSMVSHELTEEVQQELPASLVGTVAFAEQVAWRLIVPGVFYLIERKWQSMVKKQQDNAKKKWQGPNKDWKEGEYADMLDKYGSYWKMVEKDEWIKDN